MDFTLANTFIHLRWCLWVLLGQKSDSVVHVYDHKNLFKFKFKPNFINTNWPSDMSEASQATPELKTESRNCRKAVYMRWGKVERVGGWVGGGQMMGVSQTQLKDIWTNNRRCSRWENLGPRQATCGCSILTAFKKTEKKWMKFQINLIKSASKRRSN